MSTVAVTKDTFDSVVSDGLVLLDFWASWCGPCRQFGPVFEASSDKHPDVTFGKIDTEAEPELAAAFGITSIPTLVAVRDGVVLYSQPGALPPQALESLVDQVRTVDMDAVRARTGPVEG